MYVDCEDRQCSDLNETNELNYNERMNEERKKRKSQPVSKIYEILTYNCRWYCIDIEYYMENN